MQLLMFETVSFSLSLIRNQQLYFLVWVGAREFEIRIHPTHEDSQHVAALNMKLIKSKGQRRFFAFN